MLPLAIFYYLYLLFVVVALLFAFFNVYHLLYFGFLSIPSFLITAFYLLITGMILVITWTYVAQIDWNATLELFPKSIL